MRIGVICSAGSGGGNRFGAVCDMILEKWAEHTIISVSGFGGEYLPGAVLPDVGEHSYIDRINLAVTSLIDAGAQMLTLLGGDGTAAYVADALIHSGNNNLPLFGLAMGTANVGPIISHDAFERGIPPVGRLQTKRAGTVEALDGDLHTAYAFNDVVIGDTMLATFENEMITADARILALEGRTVPKPPAACIAEELAIEKNGRRNVSALPQIAQIIASPIERDNLYGRAVTGVLCFSPHSDHKAALLLSPQPVVTMEQSEYGYGALAAAEQMLFREGDRIEITGVRENAMIIADGNPYRRQNKTIGLRYMPDMVTIAYDR